MAIMLVKPKGEAFEKPLELERRLVERVDYPKEGGILTYFYGHKYPEKQLVHTDMIAVINPVKRSPINFIKLIKRSHLAKLLLLMTFILPGARKLRRTALELYVDMFWSGLNYEGLAPSYYCDSGRELYRAGLKFIKNPALQNSQADILKMLCLVWEYDNSYRYRFQDIFGILDKEVFLKNPFQETKRVIKEYENREYYPNNKNKVRMFTRILLVILFFKKKIAKEFIKELDLEKVRLSKEDFYWSSHRLDYSVEGLDLISRIKKRQEMAKD